MGIGSKYFLVVKENLLHSRLGKLVRVCLLVSLAYGIYCLLAYTLADTWYSDRTTAIIFLLIVGGLLYQFFLKPLIKLNQKALKEQDEEEKGDKMLVTSQCSVNKIVLTLLVSLVMAVLTWDKVLLPLLNDWGTSFIILFVAGFMIYKYVLGLFKKTKSTSVEKNHKKNTYSTLVLACVSALVIAVLGWDKVLLPWINNWGTSFIVLILIGFMLYKYLLSPLIMKVIEFDGVSIWK